ncbi:tetratricopeptide repeat-containing sensor histidine kinase [Aquiflexum lacus]|uniref:tetratricopeptide repeat-containing sensor histidine kinase n=1 Tax=Aquiflexum lacus TaxID=2483805 RepID=UPI001895751D|nr:histidine kinase dimerization/phosphoacceptor domain -containing protein [Aquiflexum lacus]
MRYVFSLFFSCIYFVGYSQDNSKLDSLINQLDGTLNSFERIEILWEAAELSLEVDVTQTKRFTSELMEIPKIQNDSSSLIKALKIQATAERWLGNYMQSIREFSQCYDYYKHHQDTANWVFSCSYLGAMNNFMGYQEEAQKYLFEKYDLLKTKGETTELAGAVNGIAIFYANLGQNEKALSRYQEALSLYETAEDILGQASVHANLGLLLMGEGKLDEAEFHLKMQGMLDSLVMDERGLGFHFDFMGSLKLQQGKKEEALTYHLTGLKIRENLPSLYNIGESRASLANVLYELGRYNEAIEQANKLLESKNETQSLSHQERAYAVLAESFEALGDYRMALENYKNLKIMSDSIFNSDMIDVIAEKDAKFELVEQKNRIALLDTENLASKTIIAQKNKTILFIVLGLSLVSALTVILYLLGRKYLNQKKHLGKLVTEKDILLREIHHRVKNNLQLVSSLLTLQGKSMDNEMALQAINEGKNRVRSMALIHQDLYQKENLTSVNVETYLKKLCKELFNTYNIHKEQVKLKLDIDNINLDVDTLVPLGLIINELITNSLKYAFPDGREGFLEITLKENQKKLILKITDDGVGFDPSIVRENSFGQNLVKSLINQLDGELTHKNDNGTSIKMTFKDYSINPN